MITPLNLIILRRPTVTAQIIGVQLRLARVVTRIVLVACRARTVVLVARRGQAILGVTLGG